MPLPPSPALPPNSLSSREGCELEDEYSGFLAPGQGRRAQGPPASMLEYPVPAAFLGAHTQ